MSVFTGTLLVQDNTVDEIKKADLDLLNKINTVGKEIDDLTTKVNTPSTSSKTIVQYTTQKTIDKITADTTFIINSSTDITLDLSPGANDTGTAITILNIGTGVATIKWQGLVDNILKTGTDCGFIWNGSGWTPTTEIGR